MPIGIARVRWKDVVRARRSVLIRALVARACKQASASVRDQRDFDSAFSAGAGRAPVRSIRQVGRSGLVESHGPVVASSDPHGAAVGLRSSSASEVGHEHCVWSDVVGTEISDVDVAKLWDVLPKWWLPFPPPVILAFTRFW